MLKKIPKIITTIFLVAFLFQLIGFIFILTTPEISQAIDVPKLQVPIGEKFSKVNAGDKTISVPWIGEYVSAVYKYAVGIVGILATVVMMFGGVLWITAGGNQERISNAKSWITASLTGLVLVLCSYLILSTVNPDLTRFKPIEISVVQKPPETSGCCLYDSCNNEACTETTKMCTDVVKSKEDCENTDIYKNGKYTLNAKCVSDSTFTHWSCSSLENTGTKNGCCVYWHGSEATGYIICNDKTNIGEEDIKKCEGYKDGVFHENELCTNITECPD